MAAVAREGDNCSGDRCFPPVPMLTPPQSSVYVNGILVGIQSTGYTTHSCGDSTHSGRTVTSGSSSVFINGQPVSRIGDSISCGAVIAQGSGNVFVGG